MGRSLTPPPCLFTCDVIGSVVGGAKPAGLLLMHLLATYFSQTSCYFDLL